MPEKKTNKKEEPKKEVNFEASMKRLVELTERLEAGSDSLEASLKLFEEGSALAARCYTELEAAEQKIRVAEQQGKQDE